MTHINQKNVLLGLILLNFFPLSNLPNNKPPISLQIHTNNAYIINIL